MRRLLPALALMVAPACASLSGPARSTIAPAPSLDSLRARIVTRIAAQPGAEVAVYYVDLGRGDSLALAANVSMHAASTMKIPVMIELFRRVDDRSLALNQTLVVENRFSSIVDGSPFTLDSRDDSDDALYTRIGRSVTLRELDDRMITRSSNLATNLLIGLLDANRINATAHALGARHMQVLRGVEDDKAFAKGLNNTTTARDLGVLLRAIEQRRAASPRSCAAMRSVLLRQEFGGEIPAGLPAGTRVAHKTGWITGTLHDAAIVYPARRAPYILVVLTRKIAAEKSAQALIADISREVYAYATRPSASR